MTGNDEFLREKAKLLIARERELLGLKRKHRRLALWLALTQGLAALVDPKSELSEVCRRVSERMVAVLELHKVLFFEFEGSRLRPIALPQSSHDATAIELDEIAVALITAESTGMCIESNGQGQASLAQGVGLFRFLWHRMPPIAGPPVLFVAGYDRERARFYAPFDEDDIAHFTTTAHQLALLLANNDMVRQLERDKRALQEFSLELEQRVDERTRELEQTLDTLRQKDRRLEEDIEEARLFQQKVLAEAPRTARVEFATWYQPLERVGGDVFDVCESRPGAYRVFLADATGHGVQASMRTILIKTEYERLKAAHASVRSLIEALNLRLLALFPGGEIMCTGCCVDVTLDDDGSANVCYANAGNSPLVHWSDGVAKTIHGDTPFLGVTAAEWPEPITFRISPGDMLLVASDGLTEQRNELGACFEDVVVTSRATGPATAFVEHMLREFNTFRGSTAQSDDVTLVALRLPSAITTRS